MILEPRDAADVGLDIRHYRVGIGRFQLEDMAELAGGDPRRIGAPGLAVVKRVAHFLVDAQSLDFGPAAVFFRSIAVAIPPLVFAKAESKPERAAALVG